MKIPKFLKILMAFFIVLAFIRSVNNAGPLLVDELLVQIESFDFSFDSVEELLSLFEKGSFSSQLKSWDADLSLFDNLGNVLGSFFGACWNFLVGAFMAFWHLLLEVLGVFVQIFNICCSILGFDFYIDWAPNPGGYRGGR